MPKAKTVTFVAVLTLLMSLTLTVGCSKKSASDNKTTAAKPALSVTTVQPLLRELPLKFTANGSIAAWQEAIIGSEISDLRLIKVNAQVGDSVKKKQVLAVFSDESVLADIAQSRAAVAETEANLEEAKANAERAKKISDSGALSRQQINQYLTGEKTAKAKLQGAKARLDAQLLRLKYTQVLASDDGVISSRTATLGAVTNRGQELFRLIRQNRLEWRGEVTAGEIAQLKTGMTVNVEVPNVGKVAGKLRTLAPTLDEKSRNGLVYVDLPKAAQQGFRAGMFARGDFEIGISNALTVPQIALSLRDGFSYVFKLEPQKNALAKVSQLKVQLGRREGDNFEVVSGINANDYLVASGASFLSDGDTVKVVKP